VPNPVIRGRDDFGSGEFGADRGNRTHGGVDIVAAPGTPVVAPVSGVVAHTNIDPYGRTPHRGNFRGIEIRTPEGIRVRMYYVDANAAGVADRAQVVAGQTVVGRVQDIAGYHENRSAIPGRRMQNHIHLEVLEPYRGDNPNGPRRDPTPLIQGQRR
jgi:murein DD-endopeptidase MepM/ murein hydrolase activator NlpD